MPHTSAVVEASGIGGVFIKPKNGMWQEVNRAFIAEATRQMLPSDAFPIRVAANFSGALNTLGCSDVEFVPGLPDNRFGRLAPYLDLIAGMLVQITQNVGTAKSVANGMIATLESVHFPPGISFQLVRDGPTDIVV